MRHYKIFCVNGNTGFKFESRIFNFIHLQNEEDFRHFNRINFYNLERIVQILEDLQRS